MATIATFRRNRKRDSVQGRQRLLYRWGNKDDLKGTQQRDSLTPSIDDRFCVEISDLYCATPSHDFKVMREDEKLHQRLWMNATTNCNMMTCLEWMDEKRMAHNNCSWMRYSLCDLRKWMILLDNERYNDDVTWCEGMGVHVIYISNSITQHTNKEHRLWREAFSDDHKHHIHVYLSSMLQLASFAFLLIKARCGLFVFFHMPRKLDVSTPTSHHHFIFMLASDYGPTRCYCTLARPSWPFRCIQHEIRCTSTK